VVRTAEKNRVEKLLEDAQIKLSSVVSDIFGAPGGRCSFADCDGGPLIVTPAAAVSGERQPRRRLHAVARRSYEHFRVMSWSRHFRFGAACPSRTSRTLTGVVTTASCSDALPRRKAPDPSWRRRPWCIPPPNRTATPLGPATQGYAATTRRALVPARRPSSPAARSHRCAPTQRPPSGSITITRTSGGKTVQTGGVSRHWPAGWSRS
jgi:hypothetical protein